MISEGGAIKTHIISMATISSVFLQTINKALDTLSICSIVIVIATFISTPVPVISQCSVLTTLYVYYKMLCFLMVFFSNTSGEEIEGVYIELSPRSSSF